PIVAFWVPAIGSDVMLPRALGFRIGREGCGAPSDDCCAVIKHHFVSRHHADAVRDGNALRITNRSKNRIEHDGALIDGFTIKPGEMLTAA
ncbi:MAG: FHA domain-containing protein, partial [Betaproteobacteria bacterium]